MTAITDMIDRLLKKWRTLPKWFRFISYYVTSIVWLPAMIVCLLLSYPVIVIIEWVIDAWKKFDYE